MSDSGDERTHLTVAANGTNGATFDLPAHRCILTRTDWMNFSAADDWRRDNFANTGENIGGYWRNLLYLHRHRSTVIVGQTFPARLHSSKEVSTMNQSNPVSIARQLLADAIAKSEPRSPWPLTISP